MVFHSEGMDLTRTKPSLFHPESPAAIHLGRRIATPPYMGVSCWVLFATYAAVGVSFPQFIQFIHSFSRFIHRFCRKKTAVGDKKRILLIFCVEMITPKCGGKTGGKLNVHAEAFRPGIQRFFQ